MNLSKFKLRVFILMGVWGILSGCAGPSPVLKNGGSLSSHLLVVPFFADDSDQCGPATLASVLSYWGISAKPGNLKKEVYLPSLRGTLPIDMFLAAQTFGMKVESYSGTLLNIRLELDRGRPLVAFLNLGYRFFPQGHYVVITGYDDRKQGLYVHSGLEPNKFVSYERFLRDWKKTGQWTLLIIPKSTKFAAKEDDQAFL
jgi:ABC-type bacteriocin/lantibiotic exporter with double-glycine peptidase domain